MLRKKRERLVGAHAARRRSPSNNAPRARGDNSAAGSDLSTTKQMMLLSDFTPTSVGKHERDSDVASVTSSLPSSAHAQQEAQARASLPVEPAPAPVEKPLSSSLETMPPSNKADQPSVEKRPYAASPTRAPEVQAPMRQAGSSPNLKSRGLLSPQTPKGPAKQAVPRTVPAQQSSHPSRLSAGRGRGNSSVTPTMTPQTQTRMVGGVNAVASPGPSTMTNMRPVTVSGGIAGSTRAVPKSFTQAYPSINLTR